MLKVVQRFWKQFNTDRSIREESQFQSEHRTPDVSSGVNFVPSDCGAPYCTDRVAQLCSVCNPSAAPTATSSSCALSGVPVPSTIPTKAPTESPSVSPRIILTTSPSFECGCTNRAAQLCSVRGAHASTIPTEVHAKSPSLSPSIVPPTCRPKRALFRAIVMPRTAPTEQPSCAPAQLYSVCNTQRSSDGDFFQWCFVWGASAQHDIDDKSTHRESQCQSEHRSHDESSGVNFVSSDCGAPYYIDQAAQLYSVSNPSAAPTATSSSGALSGVPVPSTISTTKAPTESPSVSPSIVPTTSRPG